MLYIRAIDRFSCGKMDFWVFLARSCSWFLIFRQCIQTIVEIKFYFSNIQNYTAFSSLPSTLSKYKYQRCFPFIVTFRNEFSTTELKMSYFYWIFLIIFVLILICINRKSRSPHNSSRTNFLIYFYHILQFFVYTKSHSQLQYKQIPNCNWIIQLLMIFDVIWAFVSHLITIKQLPIGLSYAISFYMPFK